MFDEVAGDLDVAVPDSIVQRGGAELVDGVDAGAAHEGGFDLVKIAGLDGFVEVVRVEGGKEEE
jgi:hypothetical protein